MAFTCLFTCLVYFTYLGLRYDNISNLIVTLFRTSYWKGTPMGIGVLINIPVGTKEGALLERGWLLVGGH